MSVSSRRNRIAAVYLSRRSESRVCFSVSRAPFTMFTELSHVLYVQLTVVWAVERSPVGEHVPSVSALLSHMAREGVRRITERGERVPVPGTRGDETADSWSV